jgi:branched-chain amino acid transport system substrate-binding protein
MKSSLRRQIWICLSELLLVLCTACQGANMVKVGFVGELSGRESDLGIEARNGVYLAAESINQSNGIAGRKLDIITADDRGDPDQAQAVDRQLIKEGVVAIIGHITSQQTLEGLSVTEPGGVVMISPTSATPKLTGKQDLFFCITQDTSRNALNLARHIAQERNVQRLAIIYDSENSAYTEIYASSLKNEFTRLGGEVTGTVEFPSSTTVDFQPQLDKLKATQPGGLMIIASGITTALIAQRTRLMNWNVPLFASEWAFSRILLENGGRAIEGLEMITSFDINSQKPAMLEFRSDYLAQFGHEPDFAAAQGYEALLLLANSLQRTNGSTQGLPQALLKIKDFAGLDGAITLDAYGDARRSIYLMKVQNGRFVTVATLETPAQ